MQDPLSCARAAPLISPRLRGRMGQTERETRCGFACFAAILCAVLLPLFTFLVFMVIQIDIVQGWLPWAALDPRPTGSLPSRVALGCKGGIMRFQDPPPRGSKTVKNTFFWPRDPEHRIPRPPKPRISIREFYFLAKK